MDNYEGDLADIVRASGGVIKTISAATITTTAAADSTNYLQMPDWQFGSSNPDLCPFPDPLLTNLDTMITSTGSLPPFIDVGIEDPQSAFYGGGGGLISNFNMFSRALQISPDMHSCNTNNTNNNDNDNNNNNNNSSSSGGGANNKSVKSPAAAVVAAAKASPRVMKTAYEMMSNEMMSIDGGRGSPKDGGFLDSSTSGIQIPSLRNPGIKRRKSQAKKVVCIPAPAGANSRQSGEVVPSDLWAWRKYGQKPIKGSPYPRGYYRCSSSKGCSARKQVERSRTDPNMLVITYTSEHNHPWPTQRNALAGSTRSQPSKITTAATSSNSNEALVKEEEITTNKETRQQNNQGKEEIRIHNGEDFCSEGAIIMGEREPNSQQDFFAELGFEGDNEDPLNLIFTQESTKTLDPFSGLFDWGAPNSATTMVQVQSNEDEHVKRVS